MNKHFVFPVIVLLLFGATIIQAQKNSTKPSIPGPDGFSINSYTGNLYYERQDFYIKGIGPELDFLFAYNSSSKQLNRGFGNGWTFNFNILYQEEDGFIIIEKGDGEQVKFSSANGAYIPEKGLFEKLEEYENGKFRLTMREGMTYYFEDNSHKRITKIKDRCDNELTLTYTDSLMNTITDATGRSINLSWTNGQLIQIDHQLLETQRTYQYEYDTEGNLITTTNPMGYTQEYAYDEENTLVQVIDENSTPTQISYHQTGGVKGIASCDFSFTLSYNQADIKTYLVEAVGDERHITTYQFDEEGRIVDKQGNCCGYNIKYAYDQDNNISKRTDGNDNDKLYVYDEMGNVISKTDAMGNEEKFQYEPVYNQEIEEIDKEGNRISYEYDAKGNTVKAIKPLGITESWTYDTNGNKLSHTDPNGNITLYEYNEYGYLVLITFADGATNQQTYDAVGNLLSQTNANGYISRIEYDALNRPIKGIDALGNENMMEYDPIGNLIATTDANGNTTTRVYDGLGQLLSTTSPEGITKSFKYDARGNVINKTDGGGITTTLEYNVRSQLTSSTDALGNTNTMEYDEVGNKIAESDRMGNFTAYEYDDNNRLIEKIDFSGNTTLYIYNKNGQMSSITNGRGFATTFEYDEEGRKIKEIDALGNFDTFVYDAAGNLLQHIDKEGGVLKYSYDARNRVIKMENAVGDINTFAFDAVGNNIERTESGIVYIKKYDALNRVIEEIAPSNEIIKYTYDPAGRNVSIVQPNGNVIEKRYNNDNLLIQKIDKEGLLQKLVYNNSYRVTEFTNEGDETIRFIYDELGRVIEVIDPLNRTQKMAYDLNGKPIKFWNPNNQMYTVEYGPSGQATTITNELGFETKFRHDAVYNLISITDAKGSSTSYTYDAINRGTQIIFPGGKIKSYKYDKKNNITERIDENGNIITYAYNAIGRLLLKTMPNGETCAYTFDERNRLSSAINNTVSLNFNYDDNNRLIQEIYNNTLSVDYTHDLTNRKTTITYPSRARIERDLNYRNLPINYKKDDISIAQMAYSNNRLVSTQLNNGINTNFEYDAAGQLKEISANLTQLFQFFYEYDQLGNRISQEVNHNPNFSETYIYDELSRLVNFKRGGIQNGTIEAPTKSIAFEYDQLGNRKVATIDNLPISYTTNNLNQYTNNSRAMNFNYSDAGSMVKNGQDNFYYDFEERLVKVEKDNKNIQYNYDALGRRYEKIIDDKTIRFYYDQKQVIEERDRDGEVLANYIFAPGIDNIIAKIIDNQLYYYHQNALGSVIGISNENGEMIERYEYTPFGQVTLFNGNYESIEQSAINNTYFFTSRKLDAETGLYYYRSRHYNPELGKFIQRDPLLYTDGANPYQYAQSNPINKIDPMGLSSCDPIQTIPLTFDILEAIGGNGGSLSEASANAIEFSKENCRECCEEKKRKGNATTWSINVQQIPIRDEGDFLKVFSPPPVIALLNLARRFNVEIFFGITVDVTFSVNASITNNACGNYKGGGCLSAEFELGLMAKIATPKVRGSLKDSYVASVGGGGKLSGSGSVCYECDPKQCQINCNIKAGVSAIFWLGVETRLFDTDLEFEWVGFQDEIKGPCLQSLLEILDK